MQRTDVSVITTQGSTEAMSYVRSRGRKIDGTVDLVSSGRTLRDNGLVPWTPPITYVYPVLITNDAALNDSRKIELINKIKTVCEK